MQHKKLTFLAVLTAVVVAILAGYIGSSIQYVNDAMAESCFAELASSCDGLADEFRNTTMMDTTVLEAMAALIATYDEIDEQQVGKILRAYDNPASYLSYVEVLFPDNTVLSADGMRRDVTGQLDFAAEAAKAPYNSDVTHSTLDANENVLRNVVPVVKNGEVQMILFGTVRLSDLARVYTTNIYGGNAYVYLIDGNTGLMMLDTWHDSYGDDRASTNREVLPGYSLENAVADMRHGRSGRLGIVSKSRGGVLYMHYCPIGINNWFVGVTVQHEIAMRSSRLVSDRLYAVAAVVGVVVMVYMGCVLVLLWGAYGHIRKVAQEDQTTGLLNRNAYEDYAAANRKTIFAALASAYVDANGLHEINNQYGHEAGDKLLRSVAAALCAQFDAKQVYRVGGDEFVVLCTGDAVAETLQTCTHKMQQVAAELDAAGYSISYGVACRGQERGVDRITHEADEIMLANKRAYYAAGEGRSNINATENM